MCNVAYLDDRVVNSALDIKLKSDHITLKYESIDDFDISLINEQDWVVHIKGAKVKLYPIFDGIVHVRGIAYHIDWDDELMVWKQIKVVSNSRILKRDDLIWES